MENNKFLNFALGQGQELSDDALDSVAGGASFTPEEVEMAKKYLRDTGHSEEQIKQYEKQARDAGLID